MNRLAYFQLGIIVNRDHRHAKICGPITSIGAGVPENQKIINTSGVVFIALS